jgi:HD-like signal output (HDOD) protein
MIATPVTRERLLHVVKVLPAAPQILAQLGTLLLDMNSGLTEVTELLRRDAGLTARIIRVANSSVYNKGTPSASLVEALARVGFKEVYRLTGFAAVAQISEQKLPLYGLSGAQLRENSLLTALMMETLAPAAGLDPRLAYTAGLLRSTGKIALDRVMRDDASGAGFEQETLPLAEREIRVAGLHNCAAAATILGEWRFPEEMIVGIRDHYLLEETPEPLANLLNLAAGEAERSGHGLAGEAEYWTITPGKLDAARVGEEELSAATTRARALFETLRAVVG